ncbi:MAG: hypothetical protein AABM67_08420 [Acidobacteriota bacterium]
MRTLHTRKLSIILALGLVSLLVCSPAPRSSALAEKVTAQEIVARHLESIGSAQGRSAINTRIISGTSQVIFRTPPPGQAIGRAVLASEGSKSLVGMSFPSPVYPREQLGYNGEAFMAAFVVPGTRSALGNFLMTHTLIFKQGLMSGTLSSAWPLLDAATRNARLEYSGVKEVDGDMLHELKYLPRGGSDLKISLFFDSATFQHVRTVYERVIPATIGDRSYTNVEQRETRYKMVEEFSLFKVESGLKLPHIYKIKLAVDATGGTFLAEWVIKLTQYDFNQKIDPSAFSVSAN